MKKLKAFALLTVAAISLSMGSHKESVCSGFLPENDLDIPVEKAARYFGRNQKPGGLTEQEFNNVIDRVESLYRDQIRNLGGKLIVNRLWEKGTVNASAERDGNDYILKMYGGLARAELMTPDAYAMIVCHELGHHLGGAVKWKVINTWATVEGAADYYASTKCIRKYFALDSNNAEQLTGELLDATAVDACRNQFDNNADRLICSRSMMAGRSLATVLKKIGLWSFTGIPRFSTPDTHEVMFTKVQHPNAQCRMDTFYHGALCTVDKDAAVDDSDYHVGTCTALTHKEGLRPRCWFKPQE